MKLHSLRAHYTKKPNNVWVPKRAFKSSSEVKEQLGFDPNLCIIYECDICSALHISELRKRK